MIVPSDRSCYRDICAFFFFQAEDGIRDLVRSRGLGDVYKRQRFAADLRRGDDVPSGAGWRAGTLPCAARPDDLRPVSYTHLTLPTIYSV